MSTAAITAGAIGAAGSIGGALIGSNASTTAAGDQSQSAEQAAELQYEESQQALQFEEGEYGQSQNNLAPFLQSGEGALANLDYLTGVNPPTTTGATSGSPGAFTGAGVTGAVPNGATPQNTNNGPQPILNTNNNIRPASGVQSPYGPSNTVATVGPNGTPTTPGTGSTLQPYTAGLGATPSSGTAATGTTNLGSLVNPANGAAGSLTQAYPGGPFVAPTAAQALAMPGEQAQLQLGEQAMQQSAAAGGNLLTGGTEQALDAYGQNLASTNYQNTYNDAYNTYASGYNQFQNQQTNEYNRLASLAGVGQTSAQQLGTLGSSAASGVSSNLLSTGSNIGSALQNAGAANASGVVGSANALSGGLSGVSSNLSSLALLNSLGSSTGSADLNAANSVTADGNSF
jgi:hypothetical protein